MAYTAYRSIADLTVTNVLHKEGNLLIRVKTQETGYSQNVLFKHFKWKVESKEELGMQGADIFCCWSTTMSYQLQS